MPLQIVPVDAETEMLSNSDIARVSFNGRALVVVVAQATAGAGKFAGTQYTFDEVSGFRLLDESDLVRYWRSDGYPGHHHLYFVEAGGWAEEQFNLEGVTEKRREWLVVTGNGCLNVFAHDAPGIVSGEFDDDS